MLESELITYSEDKNTVIDRMKDLDQKKQSTMLETKEPANIMQNILQVEEDSKEISDVNCENSLFRIDSGFLSDQSILVKILDEKPRAVNKPTD